MKTTTLMIALLVASSLLVSCGGQEDDENSNIIQSSGQAVSIRSNTKRKATRDTPLQNQTGMAVHVDCDGDVSGMAYGKGGCGMNPDPGGEDEPTDPVVLIIHR